MFLLGLRNLLHHASQISRALGNRLALWSLACLRKKLFEQVLVLDLSDPRLILPQLRLEVIVLIGFHLLYWSLCLDLLILLSDVEETVLSPLGLAVIRFESLL